MKNNTCFITTPLGALLAAATPKGLAYLSFADDENTALTEFQHSHAQTERDWLAYNHDFFSELTTQLNAYFNRQRRTFSVPLDWIGTPFQQCVWTTLTQIEYGQTWSYTQQAKALGKPSAVRAVANANRVNPISILVPCHRVLGKNGTLTGYSGGLWRKAALIELEQS